MSSTIEEYHVTPVRNGSPFHEGAFNLRARVTRSLIGRAPILGGVLEVFPSMTCQKVLNLDTVKVETFTFSAAKISEKLWRPFDNVNGDSYHLRADFASQPPSMTVPLNLTDGLTGLLRGEFLFF